ncbi:nifJ, partial [Symbiodinium sp. KB8]
MVTCQCGANQYEKRGFVINALSVVLDKGAQCDKCVVPAHAAARLLAKAPGAFEEGSRGDGVDTQPFGDRPMGCSIQGGPAPSLPHTVDSKGEGTAWDAADFGFGMRKTFKLPHDYRAKQVEDALGGQTVMVSGAVVMQS